MDYTVIHQPLSDTISSVASAIRILGALTQVISHCDVTLRVVRIRSNPRTGVIFDMFAFFVERFEGLACPEALTNLWKTACAPCYD